MVEDQYTDKIEMVEREAAQRNARKVTGSNPRFSEDDPRQNTDMEQWIRQQQEHGDGRTGQQLRKAYLIDVEHVEPDIAEQLEGSQTYRIPTAEEEKREIERQKVIIDLMVQIIGQPELAREVIPQVLVKFLESGLEDITVTRLEKTADGKLQIKTKARL